MRSWVTLGVVAASVLAMGTLWTTQAAAGIERVDTTRQRDRWSETGAFDYRVPVVNATPLHPAGTILGMGEPGYFVPTSPRVDLTFHYTIDDPRASASLAKSTIHVLARGRDGSWTHDVALATGGPDVAATLDVEALQDDIARLRGTLPHDARVVVIATVTLPDREASTFELPITFEPPLYVLPDASHASATRAHATTDVETHYERGGLHALRDQPQGPLAAGLGLAGLAFAWRRREAA